jgi:hypothetical protein
VRDATGMRWTTSTRATTRPRRLQAKMLTPDEAGRIAINIARLLELLGRATRN